MNINVNGFGMNNRYYGRNRNRSGTTYVINKPWQKLLFCIIFIILGLIIGIYAINSNTEAKNFSETTAVVIDYDYDSDGLAAIVVEYNVDGVTYKDTSDSRSSHPKAIGSNVTIAYNPDNPNEVIWNNDLWLILMPIIAILFIAFGILGSFSAIKKGMSEGFNSGSNEVYHRDQFGNYYDLNQTLNTSSRFDYSNQNNQYNNYHQDDNTKIQNSDFDISQDNNNYNDNQNDFNNNQSNNFNNF